MSTLDKKTMDRLMLLLGGFMAVENEGSGRLGVQVNHFVKQHDVEIIDRIAGKKTETLAKCSDPNVAEAFALLYQYGYGLLNELEKRRVQMHASEVTPTVIPRRFWFIDDRSSIHQDVSADAPVRHENQITTIEHLFRDGDPACVCGVEMFVGNAWVPGDIQSSRSLVTKRLFVEIQTDKDTAPTLQRRITSNLRDMTGVVDLVVTEQP